MTRAISVAGGKAGVGNTTLSINLAICLASKGYRSCLLITDPNSAKNQGYFDFSLKYDLTSAIKGEKPVSDIIVRDYYNTDILFFGNALEILSGSENKSIINALKSFPKVFDHDFLIIDASSENLNNKLSLCSASSDTILIMNPDPASISGAYELLKMLSKKSTTGSLSVIINQGKNVEVSDLAANKLIESAKKSFNMDVANLGMVVKDKLVSKAVNEQKPFFIEFPASPASESLQKIVEKLLEKQKDYAFIYEADMFWDRLLKSITDYSKSGNFKTISPKEKDKAQKSEIEETIIAGASYNNQAQNSESDRPYIPKESQARDLVLAISDLVAGISELSKELNEIKNLLKQINAGRFFVSQDDPSKARQLITLDFEEYISSRIKQ